MDTYKIMSLDFNKDKDNKTILSDQENIDKLLKWVFPIIEKNEGWGSGALTKEKFLNSPYEFQDTIDASIWNNVHILLDNDEPVALLEFSKTTIADSSKARHSLLDNILNGSKFDELNKLIGRTVDRTYIPAIKAFLSNKSIYTSVVVVLKPELQGKKTGMSETLYEIISDGIVFGWTSNPIIVRQRKKIFIIRDLGNNSDKNKIYISTQTKSFARVFKLLTEREVLDTDFVTDSADRIINNFYTSLNN